MTKNIKNIAFDLGGVVIALSYEGAIRRFEEIGLKGCPPSPRCLRAAWHLW